MGPSAADTRSGVGGCCNALLAIKVPTELTRRRERRGPVSSPRHGQAGTDPIVIAAVPARRVSGRSKRASYHGPRTRKLSPEQQAAIWASRGNRSLRELAAQHGVSHETVRPVLRASERAGSIP